VGLRSAGRLVKLTGQRVSALAGLAARIGRASAAEFSGLLHAWRADRLGEQVGDRTAAGIDAHRSLLTHSILAGVDLLWDAGIEPAPYKDLPFAMPMEAHVGLMAANGAAEATYVASRMSDDAPARSPKPRHPGLRPAANWSKKWAVAWIRWGNWAKTFGVGYKSGAK